jgi:hypothetical protein
MNGGERLVPDSALLPQVGGVIRRVFRNVGGEHFENQTLVEFWPASGVMRVATRRHECDTWSPPAVQLRSEDGPT